MKSVLYIAPIGKDVAQNGGYNRIANNILSVLLEFEKENKISLTVLNIKDFISNSYIESFYDVNICLTHPDTVLNNEEVFNVFKRIPAKEKFLYTVWETEPFPNHWKKLNEIFDGYIGTSNFCVDEMEKLTEKKCYKFPFYLESKYEKYRMSIDDKKNEDIFTVLFVGQYTKRKGLEDAISAFSIFSQDKKDVQFNIKYHNLSQVEVPFDIMAKNVIQSNCKSKPNIFLIEEELNEDQIYDMYKQSSCLFLPSRGEGVGLPLIESNIVGIPVIYTDFSSFPEYGEMFKNNIPIKCIKDYAIGMSQYNYESTSLYGVPYISSCVDNLNLLYANWKKDKIRYYSFSLDCTNDIFERFDCRPFERNLFYREVLK